VSRPVVDVGIGSRPPVVVGGFGGSGTRLIAQVLGAEGYFLGADLNEASDNLWFTLLFKRAGILDCSESECADLCAIFLKGMIGGGGFTPEQHARVWRLAEEGRDQHDATWLKARAGSLLSRQAPHDAHERWGWKEPNTHIVLDRLNVAFPGMRYILVSRHGLDMAVSGNQNQPRLWGPIVLGEPFEATPRYSLRYWCFMHRRVMAIGAAMGDRFLFLKYDDVCRDPKQGLVGLRAFLGTEEADVPQGLLDLVAAAPTIGRHRRLRQDELDADDIAYVESLGFPVTGFAGHDG
jgi:hypothetical protein